MRRTAATTVTRIQDHGEWFSRFSDKLNVLPDEQKQHSAIDVLGAYAQPHASVGAGAVACDNFKELVKRWSLGREILHLGEKFLHVS